MATNADPNAPLNANVGAVLKEIASKGEAFSQKEPGARESLIASARSLIAALETPMETVLWMIWAEVRNHSTTPWTLVNDMYHSQHETLLVAWPLILVSLRNWRRMEGVLKALLSSLPLLEQILNCLQES